MYIRIVLFMLAFCMLSCRQQVQESPKPITAENFQAGPQLVKIMLDSPDVLQQLEAQNVEIIVQEDDYVIARLDQSEFGEINAMSVSLQQPKESDLVQRLIAVQVSDSSEVAAVNNSGINIWETHGDSIVAQAFDNQIKNIEAMGISVEILEDDIQNVVKKISQK